MESERPSYRVPYQPPPVIHAIGLWTALAGIREVPQTKRTWLPLPGVEASVEEQEGPRIYYAGDLSLLQGACVSIVGSRKVSAEGAARTRRLARELVSHGVVIVSGLAEGVDTEAHRAAIDNGGRTIAVIGTPIDSAYPAKNARLQEAIYRDHLLVSPFADDLGKARVHVELPPTIVFRTHRLAAAALAGWAVTIRMFSFSWPHFCCALAPISCSRNSR